MSSDGGACAIEAAPKGQPAVPAMDPPAPAPAGKGAADEDAKPKAQIVPYRIQPEAAPKIPKLTMAPLLYFKVLHLIRHGEGFHNAAAHRDGTGYVSWDYEDAQLTAKGWKQARALNAHLKSKGIQMDLIEVSPLARTLQTAAAAFGEWQDPPAPAAAVPAAALAPVAPLPAPPQPQQQPQQQQQQQTPQIAPAFFPFGGFMAANQQQQQQGGFTFGQPFRKQAAAGPVAGMGGPMQPGAAPAAAAAAAVAAVPDSHRHPAAAITGGVVGAAAALDHQVGQVQPLGGAFGPFQPKLGPVWGQGLAPAAAAAAQGPPAGGAGAAGHAPAPAAAVAGNKGDVVAKAGEAAGAAGGQQRQVLMQEVGGGEGRASPHPMVYVPEGCAPMYANELCREMLDTGPCNRRHMLSTKREAFPGVIFEAHMANEDPMFSSSDPETWEQAVARARTFLMQLLNRPETHIAVVSHGTFLQALGHALGSEVPKEGAKYMRRHMMNAELRSVVVTTWGTAGSGRPNTDYVPYV